MEEVVINASRREVVGKQVKALRREGKLPAILYGRHIETIPLLLNHKEVSKILQGLSPSALISVRVDGQEHFALVREKQRNHLLGILQHVDFQAVSLTEKVRALVSIDLVGESPAVEDLGGILVTNVEQLDVESLPRDLPERIEVDISVLKEIGDAINVRDLTLPGDVVVHADPDDVIAVVTMPAAEEILEEEEEEEVEEFEPEIIERGKREEEEE